MYIFIAATALAAAAATTTTTTTTTATAAQSDAIRYPILFPIAAASRCKVAAFLLNLLEQIIVLNGGDYIIYTIKFESKNTCKSWSRKQSVSNNFVTAFNCFVAELISSVIL